MEKAVDHLEDGALLGGVELSDLLEALEQAAGAARMISMTEP